MQVLTRLRVTADDRSISLSGLLRLRSTTTAPPGGSSFRPAFRSQHHYHEVVDATAWQCIRNKTFFPTRMLARERAAGSHAKRGRLAETDGGTGAGGKKGVRVSTKCAPGGERPRAAWGRVACGAAPGGGQSENAAGVRWRG